MIQIVVRFFLYYLHTSATKGSQPHPQTEQQNELGTFI